jgi:hypothetical protein
MFEIEFFDPGVRADAFTFGWFSGDAGLFGVFAFYADRPWMIVTAQR